MKAAGAFEGLPRPKLRWNIRGYIAERKSFSTVAKPSGNFLLTQLSHAQHSSTPTPGRACDEGSCRCASEHRRDLLWCHTELCQMTQAELCRRKAIECEEEAKKSSWYSFEADAWLKLAKQWRELADSIERQSS
jgi:hypothetical protein